MTSGRDSYSNPMFAPGGKALFAEFEAATGRVYNLNRIARLDWPGSGKPSIVTSRLDRSVTSFGFSADSRTLWALAEESGHEKLFSAPAAGGEARLAVDLKLGAYSNLRPENGILVANWDSSTNPLEAVRIDPATGRHTALTNFSRAVLDTVDWQAPAISPSRQRTAARFTTCCSCPPPGLRREAQVSTRPVHPRRTAHDVPRSVPYALELSLAHRARIAVAHHQLHGFHGIRRGICARDRGRSVERARRGTRPGR